MNYTFITKSGQFESESTSGMPEQKTKFRLSFTNQDIQLYGYR